MKLINAVGFVPALLTAQVWLHAATELPPQLRLTREGTLTVHAASNETAVVEASANLRTWEAYGRAIHGDPLEETLPVALDQGAARFFRASPLFSHGVTLFPVTASNLSHLLVTESGEWAALLHDTNDAGAFPGYGGMVMGTNTNTIATVYADTNGRPWRLVGGRTVLLFANYRSNLVDVASILADGTTNLLRGLVVPNDWEPVVLNAQTAGRSLRTGAWSSNFKTLRRLFNYTFVEVAGAIFYYAAEATGANQQELNLLLKAIKNLEERALEYSGSTPEPPADQTEDPTPAKVKEYGPFPDQPDTEYAEHTQMKVEEAKRQAEKLIAELSDLIEKQEASLEATSPPPPAGMVLIPAGSFQMGDTFGEGQPQELPVHTVTVSAFYMDRTEVTLELWREVRNWAVLHGYSFDREGLGKGLDHPVHSVNWYDVVKWCNARSEKEGLVPAYYFFKEQNGVIRGGHMDVNNDWVKWNTGYRLPTEAEWEYAARGGLSGKRFPWGDTISHSQANYRSHWEGGRPYWAYDVNGTVGVHPTYATGDYPYTSPVGSFAVNGYGLYDMAGNVWEWCWDWYGGAYGSLAAADPRGPGFEISWSRMVRGGGWSDSAGLCRVSYRRAADPDGRTSYSSNGGFRSVLPAGQP